MSGTDGNVILNSLIINPDFPVTMLGFSEWTISVHTSAVVAHNTTLINSNATGGSVFTALSEDNNVDGGGNTGWIFSSIISTQDISGITPVSGIATGEMLVNANRRGFCYVLGTSGDPTISDSVVYEDGNFTPDTYTNELLGLSCNSSYRVRSYISIGPYIFYGNTVQFITELGALVTTNAPTGITDISCMANGEFSSVINATRRGFCYIVGTSGEPTILDSVIYEDGDYESGIYTLELVGLTNTTNYRIKAYIVVGSEIVYGETIQLVTESGVIVTTQAVTDITLTGCTANGEFTTTTNASRRGFCYMLGSAGDPTISDSVIYEDGSYPSGTYSLSLTSLVSEAKYQIRSYVVIDSVVFYGDTVTARPAHMTFIDNLVETTVSIVSARYYIDAPTFSIPTGYYANEVFPLSFTMSQSVNAPIYYTMDGSDPTTESSLYSGMLSIPGFNSSPIGTTKTIKAIAYSSGYSDIATLQLIRFGTAVVSSLEMHVLDVGLVTAPTIASGSYDTVAIYGEIVTDLGNNIIAPTIASGSYEEVIVEP